MALILPRELIPATPGSPRILTIYGPPKVGKTSIVSCLPSALLVDLEDGSNYVSAMKLKLDNALQIPGLVKQIIDAGRPYKYIIVDTIDKIEEWAEAEATRKYKNSPIGKNFSGDSVLELPKGAGYLHLRNEFKKFFDQFRSAANYVIFIGHVRDKDINNTLTTTVASKDLDLTGKIRNIVCSMSDAIGHIYRDKDGKLVISFTTTEGIQCGSRCAHLRGATVNFSTPAVVEDWRQIYTDL
jgi:hypothetical protein